MEQFDNKTTVLVAGIVTNNNFISLQRNRPDDSLSLLQQKKNWKIMKIKFGIKIGFLKIIGTDNLISQKMGDENELPQQTSNMTLFYFPF